MVRLDNVLTGGLFGAFNRFAFNASVFASACNWPVVSWGKLELMGLLSEFFFFGFFVPIFRGEIGIGLMHLIFSIITFGLFHLIMPFLYNRQYTTRLLTSGWKLNDSDDRNTLARLKIGISE